MKNQRQNFHQALSILNSLLVPIFFLTLIDTLNLLFLLKLNFIFILLIVGSLKIYCMSGVSGCILEILSGEEFVLQFRRVHQNVKDLWQGFLIVFVMIRLVDFSLYVLFPSFRMWRNSYFSLLGIITVYVLARWTINKKYVGPLALPRRRFRLKLSFLMVMILACLLELILVRAQNLIRIESFYWRNISVFILNYIHVFEFIFCSLYILDVYPEIKEKFRNSLLRYRISRAISLRLLN